MTSEIEPLPADYRTSDPIRAETGEELLQALEKVAEICEARGEPMCNWVLIPVVGETPLPVITTRD